MAKKSSLQARTSSLSFCNMRRAIGVTLVDRLRSRAIPIPAVDEIADGIDGRLGAVGESLGRNLRVNTRYLMLATTGRRSGTGSGAGPFPIVSYKC